MALKIKLRTFSGKDYLKYDLMENIYEQIKKVDEINNKR